MSITIHCPQLVGLEPSNRTFGGSLELLTTGTSNLSRSDLVSNETRQMFQVVLYVIIGGLISLFGIFANLVNITVFVKQGFRDSMNISLLGLAMADLAGLMTMFWISMCFNPLFINADLPFDPLSIMYLSGGMPHVCFNRITSFITAFITLERCLCITHPLKVKRMITPARTRLIIVSIYVMMFTLFAPFYFVNKLEMTFNPLLNKTVPSIAYADNREMVESVTFFIHSVAMSGICLIFVIACTCILVIKLTEKTKWRLSAAAVAKSNPETVSVKEKKVVKMVTLISTIFIICFVPATAIFFMMAYDPEFSFSGQYQNIFFVVWSVAVVLETINSSVNIFVYFNMSSKFRLTLLETFCCSVENRQSTGENTMKSSHFSTSRIINSHPSFEH